MNSPVSRGRASRRRLRFALPCLALIFVAGCASTPIPAPNLQAAQLAIANAERVDAATHAAAELGEARAKLTFAQHAVDEEDMLMAGQFADQARASAELAAAKIRCRQGERRQRGHETEYRDARRRDAAQDRRNADEYP